MSLCHQIIQKTCQKQYILLILLLLAYYHDTHRRSPTTGTSVNLQATTYVRIPKQTGANDIALELTRKPRQVQWPPWVQQNPDTSTRIFFLCSYQYLNTNKTVFDGEPLIVMPPPTKVSVTLTFDPTTLKTFSAMATHMMNISAKFDWNHSTKYRNIASRKIGVKGQPDGQTDDPTT